MYHDNECSRYEEETESILAPLILAFHDSIEQNQLEHSLELLENLTQTIYPLEFIEADDINLIEESKILYDLLIFFDEARSECTYQCLCFLSQLAYISDDIVRIIFNDQLLYKYIQKIRSGTFGEETNGQILRLIGACVAVDSQIRTSVRDYCINDIIFNGLNSLSPKNIEDAMFCLTEYIKYCKNDIGLSYFSIFVDRIIEIMGLLLESDKISNFENLLYLCVFFFHIFSRSPESINELRKNKNLEHLIEIFQRSVEIENSYIKQFSIGGVVNIILFGEQEDKQLVFSLIDPSLIITYVSAGDYTQSSMVLKYINAVVHCAPEIIENVNEQGFVDLICEVLCNAQGFLKSRICEVICEMILILCNSTVSRFFIRDEILDLIIDIRDQIKDEDGVYSSYNLALQKLLLCASEGTELHRTISEALEDEWQT